MQIPPFLITPSHPIITLTTDFGTRDVFVGTMKGVIWSICPEARIADISHEIFPQNVLEGAYALWRACKFFPAGTIHVAVIDPGVGTSRRPIAAHLNGQFFVGPDNGLFSPIYESVENKGEKLEIIHLTNEKYFLPIVSRTFHGRDVFAPVAAHLAKSIPLSSLGPEITDPVRLPLLKPVKTSRGWHAHIIGIDQFGNCTTNLPANTLTNIKKAAFHIKGREISSLSGSYGESQPGSLIALVDSENFIEIAAVGGNAAKVLKAQVGDPIKVILQD